ncbi:DUR3-Urea permease [Fusarium agapanthi]|uniref:DUR3-Urea permease n=1 Tax=Fusarium agapanthi TaxID=1803897 RepID=A0A9P5BI72_9HYPO|nr:DUR3-Urea permease [Fusarium agapanthi]
MIPGASAAMSFLTRMHIMASTILLPLGVVLYTLVGGIEATFLTDYVYTFAILILNCWLTAKVITSESMGMGYFLKAFAASPSAVVPGYLLGGISYISIPWSLSTIVGMASLGLEALPVFPTYPRLMTSAEFTNGLVLPYVAVAVAGKGGAVAVLLMTLMAATSTLSAQILVVSSILTFDIYRVYFNQEASNKQVIRWGHIGVVLFGIVAAAFTAMFHYIGVDMGWTLYMLGILTCPGVIPLIVIIIWRKQTKLAAISSTFLGIATGLGVWLGSAFAFSGEVTVASTGETLPCMYGTVASLFSPLLYSVAITCVRPDSYDWSHFKEHRLAVELDESSSGSESSQGKGTKQVTRTETASHESVVNNNQQLWTKYALWWAIATFLGH